MRITERRLRKIIRNIIVETALDSHSHVSVSSDDPRFDYVTDFIVMGTDHFLNICKQRGCSTSSDATSVMSEIDDWCYENLEDPLGYEYDAAGVFLDSNNEHGEVNMLEYVCEKIKAGVKRMLDAGSI